MAFNILTETTRATRLALKGPLPLGKALKRVALGAILATPASLALVSGFPIISGVLALVGLLTLLTHLTFAMRKTFRQHAEMLDNMEKLSGRLNAINDAQLNAINDAQLSILPQTDRIVLQGEQLLAASRDQATSHATILKRVGEGAHHLELAHAEGKQLGERLKSINTFATNIDRLRGDLSRLTDLELMEKLSSLDQAEPILSAYARNRLVELRRSAAFARMADESRIRELYAQELFPGLDEIVLPLGAINELSGHPNKAEMLYVCGIPKLRGAKRIFEFGTYLGRTTLQFAALGLDVQVVTIDLPRSEAGHYAQFEAHLFKGRDEERRITEILENSRTFDTTPHIRSFDFVFVDGDHGYDGVRNDTLKAFELLSPGGGYRLA